MAPRGHSQSKQQKGTVSRVMHEYKHGELRTGGTGPKVKSRRQAIAIALSESGSSNQQGARRNASALHKTKVKERHGETAEAMTEGKRAQTETMKEATGRKSAAGKSAAKKSVARKTAIKKSAAKKTSAKKAATRKTVARKTTPRNARTSATTRARGIRGGKTKAMLYAEARRKQIPGRSRMSKGELVRALG